MVREWTRKRRSANPLVEPEGDWEQPNRTYIPTLSGSRAQHMTSVFTGTDHVVHGWWSKIEITQALDGSRINNK